ncbi:choline-phosphate cytidylyltransferase, partial [Coprococcus eutactus]|nr:choline-phosphate cytidylyltransferase [Coprococcus eutactus]
GADKTLIYIDEEGCKISDFVENIMECDFEMYPDQLDKAMEYLRAVDEVEVSENAEVKQYDLVSEALRLMKL